MRIGVIGAGASGLMISGLLAKEHDVTVFDKNEKVGKKLFITGKGRCNLTNLCDEQDFLKNVVRGDKFLKSAIYSFSSQDCVDFFEGLGLKTKLERGNRVFPESDKSSDVIKVLKEKHCKNVRFVLDCEVVSIEKKDEVFVLKTNSQKFEFDRVIVCTGGVSYKGTGACDAGYKFAKKFGHNIVELKSALCPIKIRNKFVKALQGVSLKNVSLLCEVDNKKLSFFGEMLFTDAGISGPIVLSASSFLNRAKKVSISIDFKPALTEEQVDKRLLRDFEENKNKNISFVLNGLLPRAVSSIFAKEIGLDEDKKVHDIKKEERSLICKSLKNFKLEYGGLYDIDTGIVTSGGIDLREINPKTFESKLVKGLYFLGEVLDVDALTGGFNLQIAWATAYCCAKNFV